MQRLLNELLELSRIGRLKNEPEVIPFEVLAREALDLVAGNIQANNVKVEIQKGMPDVYGDRQRLLEMVQNLLDNAAKFMGNNLTRALRSVNAARTRSVACRCFSCRITE